MKYSLSDICEYVKDKIDVGLLNKMTYISTENMLPNRGGLKPAVALPDTKTTRAFCKGDVLVSNIRPYFKKIWFATFDGGCSNDILVFRARDGINKQFLYYILANDNFFKYSMATSKGTKMTIWDKKAIMEYGVPVYSAREQEKLVSILNSIDQKIQINNKINENLEIQARALFQAWFIDYTLFDGNVPDNWRKTTLREIAVIKTNSWSPVKSVDIEVEYYSIPNFDANRFPTFEMSSNIKSNKYILTPKSVMISKLNPSTKRIWRPINLSSYLVCSTEFIVYEARKIEQKDYLYSLLDSVPFFNYLCTHTTGSTNSRQRVLPNTTLDFPLYLPPDSIIKNFCQLVMPVYDLIATNLIENKSLVKTRDSLLHLLLSGTSDISKQLNSRLS